MSDVDLFDVFRSAVFVGLTAYYVITTGFVLTRVLRVLGGRDPRMRLLRAYLSYHLVTIRLQPLAGELLQIGLWTTMLLVIWWMH